FFPVIIWPSRRLVHGYQDKLSFNFREPFLKSIGIRKVWKDDQSCRFGLSVGSRTPRQHRSFKCRHTGGNQINMSDPPFPTSPLPPLFVPGRNSSAFVFLNCPIMGLLHLWRPHKTRTNKVGNLVTQTFQLRVFCCLPDNSLYNLIFVLSVKA